MNLTLYSITAFIILDTDGNRVLSKYYRQETTAASPSATKGLASTKNQRAFEKGLTLELCGVGVSEAAANITLSPSDGV